MHDPYYERLRQGILRESEFNILLPRLQKEGYWIGFIRLRFSSSRRIYSIPTTNMMHQERVWTENRDFYDAQIQQWINNVYQGNTRSRKRKSDNGWQLIGRWERGPDGFLHVHGFLCVYIGSGSALGFDIAELMVRMKRPYHPQISDVWIKQWWGSNSGGVKYSGKQSWMVGSGEDLLFARAPV